MNQTGRGGNTGGRKKNARGGNKKKQQKKQASSNSNGSNDEEIQKDLPEVTTENEENEKESGLEESAQQSEEQHEKENGENTSQVKETVQTPTHVEDEQEPMFVTKQKSKNKPINNKPSNATTPKEEIVAPIKPQASVAPVKQVNVSPSIKHSTNHMNSSREIYSKSNGHMSPLRNIYSHSASNPLPPRFQQQLLQKEAEFAARRYRRKRGPLSQKMSSLPPGSAARQNDFVPSSYQLQQEEEEEQEQEQEQEQEPYQEYYNDQVEYSKNLVQQQDSPTHNGYSSESDILTDSPSTGCTNSVSPILSTSADSQSSLQRLDLIRSLATSNGIIDELISIFDNIAFSAEDLQVILNKIATKHVSDKHDLQRLLSSRHDKTFERILDETYRSQAKILAIELQAEKSRVLELTKSNADLENSIRQLQHQQHQQPTNMAQYEQMVLSYQVQARRLFEENTRLQHQLHAYSIMPATINELKQQNLILSEQLRQMTIRNNALENEASESERASKHAAEIYKKADTEKQERIEQMIADINKYKKLDKELTNLRQKHNELEKNLNSKINEVVQQRDDLFAHCDQLKQQIQEYEQLQAKYDKLVHNQSHNSSAEIKREINDLKAKNDQLRKSNWKIMDELNKTLHEQQQKSS